jgi:hypothetical protein
MLIYTDLLRSCFLSVLGGRVRSDPDVHGRIRVHIEGPHTVWIKKERKLADGRGGRGWGRSQTIPRPGPLLIILFSFFFNKIHGLYVLHQNFSGFYYFFSNCTEYRSTVRIVIARVVT